jgi:hypothetical protein
VGAQGSSASQTLPPAKARKKSPAAPAPVANAPAPRVGGGATSPSGWTDQSPGEKRTLRKTRGQERND